MINRRHKVGDCRIKGIMSRKTQLKLFLSWAVPAICTIVAAETPARSFGVATATHPVSSSSSLWHAENDKSYNRLLQEVEVQTVVAIEVDEDHDDHDHDEEGHEDHKDDVVVDEHDDHDHDDHGDDHDDHDEHDHDAHEDEHDDHDDHGDHDEHDHDDEHLHGTETMSSENKSVDNVWGAVIGATLLVNLATFSGVLILVIPAVHRGYLKYRGVPGTPEAVAGKGGRMLDIVVPGFAVGALIATSVFLIFPEALAYIGGGHGDDHSDNDDHSDHGHRYLEDGHDDHGDGEGVIAAKFGCAILGGFLLPIFFSIFFHIDEEDIQSKPQSDENAVEGEVKGVKGDASANESECDCCDKPDAETGIVVTAVREGEDDDATPVEDPVVKPVVNKRLCATILIGDFFHNFSDGLFIAAAFKSCSQTLAIGIMLVTLAHEIPQELADFVILTQYAGLSVSKALLFNFISGLSVLFGGIIFLVSNASAEATGIVLAMGGGVYIYAAACEALPRMEHSLKVRWDRLLMLFSIILGSVPIGFILIDHKHCG